MYFWEQKANDILTQLVNQQEGLYHNALEQKPGPSHFTKRVCDIFFHLLWFCAKIYLMWFISGQNWKYTQVYFHMWVEENRWCRNEDNSLFAHCKRCSESKNENVFAVTEQEDRHF